MSSVQTDSTGQVYQLDGENLTKEKVAVQNKIICQTIIDEVSSGEQDVLTDSNSDRNIAVENKDTDINIDRNIAVENGNNFASDDKTNEAEQNEIKETHTVDNSSNRHVCNLCKKVFLQLGWFQKHMEKCQKGYECDICHLRLKNLKCLKVHKTYFHGPDSGFKCDQCDAWFSTAKKLEIHVRNVHQTEKICPHCNTKSKNSAA